MQTRLRTVQGKLHYVLILVTLVFVFMTPFAHAQNVPAPAAVIAGQAEAETPADIHVLVGRSLVVRSEENLQRVSVTNPAIAAANVISPTQVLIHEQHYCDRDHARFAVFAENRAAVENVQFV